MKVLKVVIITLVVMVLISCATTPKEQIVEIDRTTRARELIAEAVALLVAEHSERADKQISETDLRTLETLARTIRVEAERVLTENRARVEVLVANAESDCSYVLELSTCGQLTLIDGDRDRELIRLSTSSIGEITEELINALNRYGFVIVRNEDGNIIRFTNRKGE